MSQISITVDTTTLHVNEGDLLIDVLIKNSIDIPYFCYHEALGADGNCRMCMVEIDGQKRPQIACDTFVKEGMIVRTRGENINKVRQDILELELINHPVDCPICDQAGECKLQDFYMDYGLYDSHIDQSKKVQHSKRVDLGSNVVLDQERCVLCARCTRFTSEITKTHELGIIGRGDHACVSTMPGSKLDNPYAMNVVDLCPVGALTSKDFRFNQRVWFLQSTESICHGCAKGCNIFIDHNKVKYQDDLIYRFRPRKNEQINGHFICDEGRLSYKNLQKNRQLEATTSIDTLKNMIDEAQNIVILIDANLYNEEIEAVKTFGLTCNATIVSLLESYYDESFGDDWLKSPWRAANIQGIKNAKIATQLPSEPIDLLISFNHPDTNSITAKQSVVFATHKTFNAKQILPIAAYSETSGTLTNSDGITQQAHKAIDRNDPIPTIKEYLEQLS
jgi:NADH-quinone oxidoreductase subunit G